MSDQFIRSAGVNKLLRPFLAVWIAIVIGAYLMQFKTIILAILGRLGVL